MGNLIDLGKKAKVVLEKKNLNTVKADIQVAVDISGSMSSMFSNGTVQEIIDRLLGIGVNMDVDDSIDVFAFNTGAKFIGTANRSNHKDFINDVF
ncbi:VWA domain-containing protein [Bacillus stercoris]|nr:VWA domain-containing protein [Bacillus stercoris]